MAKPLEGKVALVAGATRGAGRGIAVELGVAGATVYATGRSSKDQRSELDRSETIEGTAELITAEGGTAIPVRVDHLVPDQVRELVQRIDEEHGHLDILVNDIWGSDHLCKSNTPLWEQTLDDGLRLLRLGIDTHMITSYFALPLLIRRSGGLVVEVTDGTDEVNRAFYRGECGAFYDLAKISSTRLAFAQAEELRPHGGTAVVITPGWLRSEAMLDAFGVSEQNWRDAIASQPHFHISETPRFVGRAVAALAADSRVSRWNGQSLSSGGLAPVYDYTDLDGSRPDCWRYIREVEWAGKPADVAGYR